MNAARLKTLLPRASQEFIDLNAGLHDPVAERSFCDGTLAKKSRKTQGARRTILRYTSYRQRFLDIDNLAGGTKFLTDALRYCGAISGDTQDEIILEVAQKKVAQKAQQKTLIEIS